MVEENKKAHKHIEYFHPDVLSLKESRQDFLSQVQLFNAGQGYESFSDFLMNDAEDYQITGNGVTYMVWNILYSDNGDEIKRDLVAYYTLATASIPYEDRIRLDEEEARLTGEIYNTETCGISAIEIKMFAVNDSYQDVFYTYENEDLPVSAWVMRNIIDLAHTLSDTVVGFKALFLHSVPEAVNFYITNGFNFMEDNMHPLHGLDSDFQPMYLAFKDVYMNYDD